MIFNTSHDSLTTNNSIKIKPIKNYSSLVKKTRIESLNERILRANELINSFVEKTKIVLSAEKTGLAPFGKALSENQQDNHHV